MLFARPAVIDPIARYSSRIAICAYPTAFDAPVRGPRRNIAIKFRMKKLEWLVYQTVKKV